MAANSRSSEPRRSGSTFSPPRGSRVPFGNLADVRPGEGRLVFGASATLAGIVASHVMMETARDALFLTKLSASRLVFVYMAMALLAGLVGRFELVVGRALGRTNSLILSLMIVGLGTMIFFVAEKSQAVTFGLYLFTGLSGTLLMLQFWLFAASRFTGAQGRRLYGLIAAGGVLGAVLGGGLSTFLTAYLRVDVLLAAATGTHLLTAYAVTASPPPAVVAEPMRNVRARDAVKVVAGSAYLRRLALLTVFSTAALLLIDYLFKSITAERIPAERLANFLAGFYTVTNGLALLIQVFVSTPVLQRSGTIVTLALLPILLMLTGLVPLLVGGFLIAALVAKGADGSLRHSLHKVSTELLYLPLGTSERSSAKAFIDSVLVRGAQGLTAVALLALATYDFDSPRNLFLMVVVSSTLWFLTAASLKQPYLERFRAAIGVPEGASEIDLDSISLDSVEVVVESLSSPDENRVMSAMSLFERAGRSGLIPALMLYHPSERVITSALKLIPSKERKDWPPLTERLLDHESEEVRLAAVSALGQFGYLEKLHPEHFVHPKIRAVASFFRANSLANPEQDPKIAELLNPDADLAAREALLSAIADHGSRRWGEVLLQLRDVDDPTLAQLLPRAMVRVQDERFIPALIERLSFRDGRNEVRDALAAMGDKALESLCAVLKDPSVDPEIQLHLPRAISRFGTRRAANFLIEVLHSELPGAVRFKALRGLGRLAQSDVQRIPRERILPLIELNGQESLRLTALRECLTRHLTHAPRAAQPSGWLLVELLQDKRKQAIERLTRLLQLIHPREDLRRVYHALVGTDREARLAAGELLEVITLGYDEQLREVVRTLADPGTTANLEHLKEMVNFQSDSVEDALRDLLRDRDPPLSALAAEYAERSEIVEVAADVRDVLANNPWLTTVRTRSFSPPASAAVVSSSGVAR